MQTEFRLGVLVLALGMLAACVSAPAPRTQQSSEANDEKHDPFALTSDIESYRLSNGLRVLLNPDRRVPLAAVSVVYDVGRADDPQGQEVSRTW